MNKIICRECFARLNGIVLPVGPDASPFAKLVKNDRAELYELVDGQCDRCRELAFSKPFVLVDA